MRYPTKTSTKEFRDTIATSIARYEKYRYWASKFTPKFPVLSWQVEKSSPQISPDSSSCRRFQISNQIPNETFHNTLLQAALIHEFDPLPLRVVFPQKRATWSEPRKQIMTENMHFFSRVSGSNWGGQFLFPRCRFELSFLFGSGEFQEKCPQISQSILQRLLPVMFSALFFFFGFSGPLRNSPQDSRAKLSACLSNFRSLDRDFPRSYRDPLTRTYPSSTDPAEPLRPDLIWTRVGRPDFDLIWT